MTHLCHNVSICHIKMICIEFTEIGKREDNSKQEKTCRPVWTPHFWHQCGCTSRDLSNLFSVKAVRLKCRISWCRGSGFVSLSSSSSPSSCSIAFWSSDWEEVWAMAQENKKTKNSNEADVRWHSQISHLSFCLQMNNPQYEASCVCILPGTCWKLCACNTKDKTKRSCVCTFEHLS